jgi:hypothetical protein
VGSSNHEEYWIPSSELDAFNKAIKGLIRVEEGHYGAGFMSAVSGETAPQGKVAVAEFLTLLLRVDLKQLAALCRKQGGYGQATLLDEMVAKLDSPNSDFKRLAGNEMWGGAGAIWESPLDQSNPPNNRSGDERNHREAIVRIASIMDRLGIGTDRSRFIANVLQSWLDKRI